METYSDDVLKRTHTCCELTAADVGKQVRLCGWVRSYRDHGGVVFIDLRDREGITQVVFDLPQEHDEPGRRRYELARSIRNEWVIAVSGTVRPRGPGRENPKLKTGQIEVLCDELTVLNRSQTVPFEPDEYTQVSEETRLKYRYIDIRRPSMTAALRLRHAICRTIRNLLDQEGFIEVETPFLTKSTPEGARDFLVPSRLQPGSFYALPQSPQLFKQILMVAGLDKYYQIVRCFRDEDLRADRAPEFTQLDIEMSFVAERDVMDLTNRLMRAICEVAGKNFPETVPVMSFDEAMASYGTDAPDTRFEMLLHDVGDIVANGSFKVFTDAIGSGGIVKAMCVPGGAELTRKEIDEYTAYAAQFGAKGLAWCKRQGDAFAGGVAKFLDAEIQRRLIKRLNVADGDLLLFVADDEDAVNRIMAPLRTRLGRDRHMYEPDAFAWCWVTDFPLLEWDEAEKRYDSPHHPFTSPRFEDLEKLSSDPTAVRARAYDLVCNGTELGGGSIRIHSPELQRKIFELLGIDQHEAEAKFGFLLEALKYGAPPHGGIAFGLDRIVAMLAGKDSIREVIAFPKTQRGTCPLTGAPAPVDEVQLADLSLHVAVHHRPADKK